MIKINMDFIYLSYKLLILVAICLKFCTTQGMEIYVKPSMPTPCPVKMCITLSLLGTKSVINSLKQNTTLLFLPGDYILESKISDTNVSEFSMVSISSGSSNVSIFCHKDASFEFEGINKLSIEGFKFFGCGNNKAKLVKNFLLESVSFVGENKSETALEIDKTKVCIIDSSFVHNTAGSLRGSIRLLQGCKHQYAYVGGAIIANQSNVTIIRSEFVGNKAEVGGVIFATQSSHIVILNSSFVGNSAVIAKCSSCRFCFGGVLYTENGYSAIQETQAPVIGVIISESEFSNNTATNGAVLTTINCSISIIMSKFCDNVANECGGVLWIQASSKTFIYDSDMYNNKALYRGGVAYLTDTSISINASRVYGNLAAGSGGVVHVHNNNPYFVTLSESIFHNNSAETGGVISVLDDNPASAKTCTVVQPTQEIDPIKLLSKANFQQQNESSLIVVDSVFDGNYANYTGGVFSIEDADNIAIKNSRFLNSSAPFGSGGVFELGMVTLNLQDVEFSHNQAQIGGAIRALQSSILFVGECILTSNAAFVGGAIYAVESRLNISDAIVVVENCRAHSAGAGFHLYRSTLHCHRNSTTKLVANIATRRGGGIYALNSVISIVSEGEPDVESTIYFTKNVARLGGGIFLEVASELYIFKLGVINNINFYFTANEAAIGGAIYIEDRTNFKTCYKKYSSEDGTNCFVQIMSQKKELDLNHYVSLNFNGNKAYQTGSVLFGGLLDRCTISNTSTYSKFLSPGTSFGMIDGVTYFRNISNIASHLDYKVREISSYPLQLCFCTRNDLPDCGYDISTIHAKKGERFNLSLVAVDQISQTLANVTIYASFNTSGNGLGEGQMAQDITDTCTNVSYSIYSPKSSVELNVYPGGPCGNIGKSAKTVYVKFLDCICPVGFQQKQSDKNIGCKCICDTQLYPYITDPNCNSQTETLLKDGNFWITNLTNNRNGTTGYNYILYDHCPFDYCLSYVHINLNRVNGADMQCANNRSELLCGACKPGLSLSLGSSHCIPCSETWHRDNVVIVISFFASGILLVVFILVLNLTVAVGTLNGLIFYANIIGANTSIFFPTANLKFISIFLSWLNLEVGFDACFFDGMDTYWKTWLQLAFPVYIIVLVIIIIVVSDHSMKFSELLAKRNPVATLATLILLSYTKLLSIVISSMSFGIITYPNDSHEIIWLPDASVKYLKGKHVALFILGTLILLIGVFYTFLLFSWQWLLRYQELKLLKWIGHQRLCHFIEPYHAPYTFKHRYWTGLLLLARVILYLVFALNKSGDPGVNLIAISIVSCSLMFLKGLVSRIYKNWVVEAISMTCYLNMALLSVSTFFLQENRSFNQSIFALMSGITVISLLLLVLSHHIFIEVFLKVWKKLHKQMFKSSDEANDLSNISQIDFDSRDHSPLDESMDEYLKTNCRELSTLPDCGNGLQMQRDEQYKAPLHRNSFSDDDTDSEGSMTPLLN